MSKTMTASATYYQMPDAEINSWILTKEMEDFRKMAEGFVQGYLDNPVTVVHKVMDDCYACCTRGIRSSMIMININCPMPGIKVGTKKEFQTIRKAILLGKLGHELLHLLITDFEYSAKVVGKYPKEEQGARHSMMNIMEDPSIEHQRGDENLELTSFLQKCILENVKNNYRDDPGLGNEPDAYMEAIHALIMIGDLGLVKGDYQFPEAREVVEKLIPKMYASMICRDPAGRIDIHMEAFEIIKPLWEKHMERCKAQQENEQKLMQQFLQKLGKALSSKGVGKPSGQQSGSASGQGNPGSSQDGDGDGDGQDQDPSFIRIKVMVKNSQKGSSGNGGQDNGQDKEGENGGENKNSASSSSGSSSEADKEEGDKDGNGSSSSSSSDQNGSDASGSAGSNGEGKDKGEGKEGDTSSGSSSGSGDGTEDGKEGDDASSDGSSKDGDGQSGKDQKDGGDKDGNDSSESSSDSAPSHSNGGASAGVPDIELDFPEELANLLNQLIQAQKERDEREEKKEKASSEKVSLHSQYLPDEAMTRYNNHDEFEKSVDSYSEKQLENILAVPDVHTVVVNLRSRFKKALQKQYSEKEHKTSGRMDMKRVLSGKMTTRLFYKTTEPDNKEEISICILVDETGSMRDRMKEVKMCLVTLLEALDPFKQVHVKVVGFDTDYTGCHYYHYNDRRWKNDKQLRQRIMNMTGRSGTFLSHAIRYGSEILRKRKGFKMFIMITDGDPYSTYYSSDTEAIKDCRAAVRDIRKFAEVIGIGLFSREEEKDLFSNIFEKDALFVDDLRDLSRELPARVEKLLR